MSNPFKTIFQRNLAGAILDNRSAPDEIPIGSFRHKLNMAVSPDGRLSRARGWQRFYKSASLTNHDLHDQSVPDREPPTLLFSSVSNEGVRRLFAGTKTKLRVLDEAAGTWTPPIGTGYGADALPSLTQVRFHAAELQNKVVFTNNHDPVQIHTLGTTSAIALTNLDSVDHELDNVTDDNSGLTKAKVIVQFGGFIFLMNNLEGGVRIKSRIRWCHLNHPEWWTVGGTVPPANDQYSLADYQDLPYGEEIMAALPMGGFLWIFTNQSIWRCSITVDPGNVALLIAGSVTLACQRVYSEPKTQARCLSYPNAIVMTGTSFYYAGRDAIYEWNQYLTEPDRVEWIHRGTGIVYKDSATRINKNACESPIMEFRSATNDDDTSGGGEIHFSWPVGTSDVNSKTLVINTRAKTTDLRDYGSTAIVNFRKAAPGECNQDVDLIAANSEDYALKELDVGYSREIYLPASDTYTLVGYYSRLIWVFPFERFDVRKVIDSFLVERTPEDENDAAVFQLRVGTADSALDPAPSNGSKCSVIWRRLRDQKIGCRYKMSAEDYGRLKIQPRAPAVWKFIGNGRYLFADLTIAAASGLAPLTGGVSISHFETEAMIE